MDNLLNINLNELVSKQVQEKITNLEEEIIDLENKYLKICEEAAILTKRVAASEIALNFIDTLKDNFSKITHSESKGSSNISKDYNQYVYIEQVLRLFYNINQEAKGCYCHNNEGNLKTHLAINYYSNKEAVINLLKILMSDCSEEISFIKSFVMPYDYPKEKVVEFVKKPKYNTNGTMFDISNFWIREGANLSNMPYDLIMRSPFILEDDVFEMLLNTIKTKKSNSCYLFALPKYNKDVTQKHIAALGECLIDIGISIINYEVVKEFINTNLKSFNDTTLDFLYNLNETNNKFFKLYWGSFPDKYQARFLKDKSFAEIVKLLNHYNCTWTNTEKESFLKEYLS